MFLGGSSEPGASASHLRSQRACSSGTGVVPALCPWLRRVPQGAVRRRSFSIALRRLHGACARVPSPLRGARPGKRESQPRSEGLGPGPCPFAAVTSPRPEVFADSQLFALRPRKPAVGPGSSWLLSQPLLCGPQAALRPWRAASGEPCLCYRNLVPTQPWTLFLLILAQPPVYLFHHLSLSPAPFSHRWL